MLQKCLRFLMYACSFGAMNQELILNHPCTIPNLKILFTVPDDSVLRSTWRLLANLVVQCPKNTETVCQTMMDVLVTELEKPANKNINETAAVIHNIIEAAGKLDLQLDIPYTRIYSIVLEVMFKEDTDMNACPFLQFILEGLLVKNDLIAKVYIAFGAGIRVKLHQYIVEHVKHADQQIALGRGLLNCLSQNFNQLSNRILVWINGNDVRDEDPSELLSLLQCLAVITGVERYSNVYKTEASMFINCGGNVH